MEPEKARRREVGFFRLTSRRGQEFRARLWRVLGDDPRLLVKHEASMLLLRDRRAVSRPCHLDIVSGGDNAACGRVVDRRHCEGERRCLAGVKSARIAFQRHGEKHRRVRLEPCRAVAARDFSRKPTRIVGGVLGDAATGAHRTNKERERAARQWGWCAIAWVGTGGVRAWQS